MRATKAVTVGSRTVEVRELTVGEVRGFLKQLATAREPDLVGELLLPGVSVAELELMSDLTSDELDAFGPSELTPLIEAARELNADFFALRRRLVVVGGEPTEAPSAAPPSGG